jgi:glycosyltransferase involved in cell wall biosynthesis
MGCGIPVVASAVGGIPEQVDDGVSGLLAPAGDADTLARQIGSLLQDGTLRRQMGEQAVIAAQARFSLERMVDAYLAWYADAMARWSAERTAVGGVHALSDDI